MRKTPVSLHVEMVNNCSQRCRCCPRGTGEVVSGKQAMSVGRFREIVEHLRGMYDIIGICNYVYSDPMLVKPEVQREVVQACREWGIPLQTSSPLVLDGEASPFVRESEIFILSLSEFDLDVLRSVAMLRQGKRTVVHFFQRKGNEFDEIHVKNACCELGLVFLERPWINLSLKGMLGGVGAEGVERYDMERVLEDCRKRRDLECLEHRYKIVIDWDGRVLPCCAVAEKSWKRVDEMNLDEIENFRRNHPVCIRCKERGLHLYLSFDSMYFYNGVSRYVHWVKGKIFRWLVDRRFLRKRTKVQV